ncbi:MAG: glutamine--fructose-6-phosphate transaminase (isomerizing) [Nannocystaceae bacterium]|nr:glutamine--fructose-6-phosphate transaminase (isomerizing) [Nannocystaceae bacterium]
MCGIVGYIGENEAAPILLEGLRKLEYRGYDSAGVAILGDQGPGVAPGAAIARCEGKLANLRERLAREPIKGTTGIGHTRWATHGRPTESNAHPHRQGKVSVVHNGIIENHMTLRRGLQDQGCVFDSETDTEIFAHLVERKMSTATDLREAVTDALRQVEGTWAICVLHDDTPGEIVVAAKNAPLLLGVGEGEMFIGSDVVAMLDHTRTVVDLEDGDLAHVTAHGYSLFEASGEPVERPSREIDWSPVAAEKQGYKHFMLKEIHEQPRVLSDAMSGRFTVVVPDVILDDVTLDVSKFDRIIILACGTSWHAALCGKYLIESVARIPVEVDLASEFRYRDPIVSERDLAVVISQSGETADTLAALREAKRRGASTLAICNVVGSTIARAADQVLYTHAGPEVSVASTKAFTSQLVVMSLIAIKLGKLSGKLDDDAQRSMLESLSALPEAMSRLLGQLASIRTVARRYAHARDFLFLGRGLGFPVALEGALKLKEISYIHAEGYASGEMKHGPIALVDDDMPIVVIALRGPGYEKVVSNLEEVRARGGKIIALATVGDSEIADIAQDVVLVPDVHELFQPIVASIPLQLFAYHIADLKGTDVDQPRNLAKSVTVE